LAYARIIERQAVRIGSPGAEDGNKYFIEQCLKI